MHVIPPRHYCIIKNPVVRDETGNAVADEHGQAKLRHGDVEIRLEKEDPFPLYPGESLHVCRWFFNNLKCVREM